VKEALEHYQLIYNIMRMS